MLLWIASDGDNDDGAFGSGEINRCIVANFLDRFCVFDKNAAFWAHKGGNLYIKKEKVEIMLSCI